MSNQLNQKSAVAIITYRRWNALKVMLDGMEEFCPHYTCGVFEDCGQRDFTADVLQSGRKAVPRPHLMATEYEINTEGPPLPVNYPNTQVFMGDRNLGVAANSNRALKWFMDGDCDHLCLCNDDLFVKGDFVKLYAQAHQDLGVGMLNFCDFTQETYKWTTAPWRGYVLKFLPRFVGIMISVTRSLIEKIGYFDAMFGKFGQEHCDITIRARMAGGIQIEGQPMNQLDIEHALLAHQDVPTSVQGFPRKQADEQADKIMAKATASYRYRHFYRPYRLLLPEMSQGYRGGGIPTQRLLECGCELVSDMV